MAAGNTYIPIATTTLGTATSSITFSSISGSYTDLVLIFYTPSLSVSDDLYIQYNSDTASNYSVTILRGNGTTASSTRQSNQTGARFTDLSYASTTTSNTTLINIMNYSNTTTYKTNISRGNNAINGVESMVTLWRSTAAITTIKIYPVSGNMNTGTIASLYGIAAA